MATGSWGYSFFGGRPVSAIVLERLPATFELMGSRLALALVLGVATGVLVAAGLPLLFWLRFDFNPINLRSPKVESVATYLDLTRDPNSGGNDIQVLEPSLAAADQVAAKLRALPEVARATTLSDLIPNHQDEKLPLIANAAKTLVPVLNPESLAAAPTEPTLARAPVAEDILALDHATQDDEVRALTRTPADVERLWDVCQIPDYRKIAPANHAELVTTVYGFLMREGRIATDWFARQVGLADHTDGDIDTLSTRIAHIRTWTFAANRPDWLADPEHWQDVTRAVEDKLSDALHERLTERFVDRRTSVLMRRLRENALLEPQINKAGEVIVEGHVIGRLDGFVFLPDASSGGSEAKALQNAAQKALAGEIAARATRLAGAPDEQFVLAADGTIRWTGAAVGKLGPNVIYMCGVNDKDNTATIQVIKVK